MPADLCCVHVNPSRSLSPTEPARPSALTLDGIFAVAALPKDHPHSFKIPDRSPPKLTKNLIRSPSFANKLRGQLRRRATIRSLKAEVYDEDARQMTSEEVLASVVAAAAQGRGKTKLTGSPPTLELRKSSPLYSSSEFGRSSAFELPTSARRVQSTNALRAARDERQLSESSDVELRDLAYLNLDLASHQLDGQSNVLKASPTAADVPDDVPSEHTVEHNVNEDQPTPNHVHKLAEATSASNTNAENVIDSTDTANAVEEGNSVSREERSESHNSFHLSKSHISQQLRSMSQLSGPSDDSNRLTPEAWTFHRRERSGCFASTVSGESSRSRHLKQTSVDSTNVLESWGRVTKDPDASSSIYSRPTSPDVPEPYEIPADLAAIADWPLRSETNLPADVLSQHDAAAKRSQHIGEDDTHITIIEPDPPRTTMGGETERIAKSPCSSPSITVDRATSHKSSSSSTTKHSRLLERFTPPKKIVRKRRSIFKFLRAGSRKQTRSISTPGLCRPHLRPLVDGALEENELVTVQYELTAPETITARSVSLNDLPATTLSESHNVASSPDPRRKPSLAEHERNLSVTGDNRRRPSARDLNRLSQINKDDKHEPLPTKTSFSYYSQIQDTDPLMEAALERQLREKALFRSPSKRSVPISESSSMSFLAPSWDEPSSVQPQSPDRDPLDSGSKRPSASHLSPPHTPIGGRSRTSSLSNHKKSNLKKPIVLHTPSSVSRDSMRSKIGSSLDSWSRYPSHTRGARCASAGTADGVRTFDFALDIKHERIRGTDESDPFIPGKRVRTDDTTFAKTKKPLPKSRSATFGSFYRYYSNIFSSPPEFHGRGRRTSVATGGRLAHPELEILGPVLPVTASPQSVMQIHELEDLCPGQLAHTREHATKPSDKPEGIISDDSLLHDSTHPTPISVSFRGDSVFKPHRSEQDALKTIGSSDVEPEDLDDYFSAPTHNSNDSKSAVDLAERNPALDGTADTTDPVKRPTPSKTQTWSEAYQDCLVVPPSPAHHQSGTAKAEADAVAIPPPSLKPTKNRSPREVPAAPQHSSLEPSAAIRRFPSVTVVDDRKGHWRSVSLISIKSNKSGASAASFVRESSNDLLRLMEARERAEREKLLQPVM